MNLLKNKKFALGILMVFVVTIFLVNPIVLKATGGDTTTDKLNAALTGGSIIFNVALTEMLKTVNAILLIVLWVIGALLVIMGKVLSLVLLITLDPQFYSDGIVGTGFKISLQVADMFFLIIMVIIGIATIVQYESYALKKLLPTVILIALLINFSLPISQFIIGFADDLAIFFFNNAFKGNLSKIGDLIINQVSPAGYVVDASTGKDFCHSLIAMYPPIKIGCALVAARNVANGNAVLQKLSLASSAVVGIMVFLITLVYLMIGVVLFLIRTVALWTLIILAPLAWIAGVLPHTAHFFKSWWEKFFTWAFFPFLFALFLYISLTIVTSQMFVDLTINFANKIDTSSFPSFFKTFATMQIGTMLGTFTLFALLFGGMLMSLKLAGGASEAVINSAQKAKNWAVGAAGKALKQRVGAAGKAVGAPVLGKAGEAMARVPGLKMVGRGMLAKAGKWRSEQIADYEAGAKNIAGLQTQSQKDAYINSFAVDKSKQAGIVAALAKAGDGKTVENALANNKGLKQIIEDRADEKSLAAVAKITLDPEFLVNDKDTSKDAKTKLKEASQTMIRSMSQEDILKISPVKFDDLKKRSPEAVGIVAEGIARKINENTASEMMRTNKNVWDKIVGSIEKDAGASAPPEAIANQAAFEEHMRAYKSNIFQNKTFKLIDNGPAASKEREVTGTKIVVPSTSFEKSSEEKKSFQEMQAQYTAEQKAKEKNK